MKRSSINIVDNVDNARDYVMSVLFYSFFVLSALNLIVTDYSM